MTMTIKLKESNNDDEFRRLMLTAVPINYYLKIQPDFDTFNFHGHVSIDLIVS